MTLDEIKLRIQGSESLWWTYRFVAEAMVPGDSVSEADRAFAVDGFLRLALVDPQWAGKAINEPGPEGHKLASLLSPERLGSALDRVKLPTVRDEAMLRARMLCGTARWRKGEEGEASFRQAWQELLRVPEGERDAGWKELALKPSAVADYPQYRSLAREHLVSLTEDFYRAHFLAEAIPVAAKHSDWATFDAWLTARRALPEPLVRGHEECVIVNLEGLRALDEKREDAAVAAMRRLLELGVGLPFLGNPDTSALSKRLRAEGKHLELCDAFDALVARQDWRPKVGSRGKAPT